MSILIHEAWKKFDSGDYLGALKLFDQLERQNDTESLSLCALISMMTGDSATSDALTLRADLLGARDFWYLSQQQNRNQLMSEKVSISSRWAPSILIARLDALKSLETENYPPIESWMALCSHLIEPRDASFYFILKSIRFLWQSTMINKDIFTLGNHLLAWFSQSQFDEIRKSALIETIHFSVATALSSKEATELLDFISSDEQQ